MPCILSADTAQRKSQCDACAPRSLDCSRRLVVALTVNNGQNGTETVQATVNYVSDQTTGITTQRELASPLSISLTKTNPIVRYPLTYLQSFNSQPREVIVLHNFGGCQDGNLATSPSCGWAIATVNGVNSAIPDSQGFCCSCDLNQVLGISGQSTRSQTLNCNLFGNVQSAHCLRFENLWYAAYTIGQPQLHFTIDVTIQQDGTTRTLQLGPHAPGASTSDGRVVARLLGDFAAYTNVLVDYGATKYLMVPSSPTSHPRYVAGMSSWLLVDKTDVTLDGSVCDKVGVSYSAFRHHSNRCSRPAGSCLGNQLEDMQLADEQRLRSGQAALRRISAFRNFQTYVDQADGTQYIAFQTTSNQASVVTLTLDADAMSFIIAESSGRIEWVVVLDFQAQSGQGVLRTVVTNTGSITADYTLRVVCTAGLLGIEARVLSLMPSEQQQFNFVLYSQSNAAGSYVCIVNLFGARQTLLDSKNVSFRTTALVENQGAQGGTVVSAVGNSEEGGADRLGITGACDYWCKTFYDIPCFITFGCTEMIVKFVLLLLCVVICICCCCKASRSASFRRGLCNVCCCNFIESKPSTQQQPPSTYLYGSHPPLHPHAYHGHHYMYRTRHEHAPQADCSRTPWEWRGAQRSRDAPSDLAPRQRHSVPPSGPVHERHRPRNFETEEPRRTPYSGSLPGYVRRHVSQKLSQGFSGRFMKITPKQRAPAYLNLSGEQAKRVARAEAGSRLRSPGEAFSVQGELVRMKDLVGGRERGQCQEDATTASSNDSSHECHVFTLARGQQLQHWRWCSLTKEHVPQRPALRLDRAFFTLPLMNADGTENTEISSVISKTPTFTCINLRVPPLKRLPTKETIEPQGVRHFIQSTGSVQASFDSCESVTGSPSVEA